MKRFLVGGAVRDELLGLAVNERDWVVVGATPAQMEAAGFTLKDGTFQVYLHPETGEEHALARIERKISTGHRGFELDHSPQITLEQDLKRRDLTVNAIARSDAGDLIDPYGGLQDLHARRLRHVSAAFPEDPLRLHRCARFLAHLAPLGFEIDSATQLILDEMARQPDMQTLSDARVWAECRKALKTRRPARYFEVLRHAGLEHWCLWPLRSDARLSDERLSAYYRMLDDHLHDDGTQQVLTRLCASMAFAHLTGQACQAPQAEGYPLEQLARQERDQVRLCGDIARTVCEWQESSSWLLQRLLQHDAVRRLPRFLAACEAVNLAADALTCCGDLRAHCQALPELAHRIREVKPHSGGPGRRGEEIRASLERGRQEAIEAYLTR